MFDPAATNHVIRSETGMRGIVGQALAPIH